MKADVRFVEGSLWPQTITKSKFKKCRDVGELIMELVGDDYGPPIQYIEISGMKFSNDMTNEEYEESHKRVLKT